MNNYLTPEYIRIFISVLSLVFAVWQYFRNRRIKKLISLEAIELHKNIAKVLGATQSAKIALENGNSPNFEIGRAEGISQAILYESAKLYCNLKDTKIDDIDDLISSSQLQPDYRHIYYSFSDARRGWISKQIKKIKKLF